MSKTGDYLHCNPGGTRVGCHLLLIATMDNVMTLKDPLLTPKEAAALLSVSPRTLENWRTQDTGPAYYMVGIHPKYTKQSLLDYLKSRHVNPKKNTGSQCEFCGYPFDVEKLGRHGCPDCGGEVSA